MIFFDHTDLNSAGRAKGELQVQIEASLSSPPDNPISDGMRLAQLQAGNVEEQTLALVLDRLQRLAQATEQIDERLRKPVKFPPVGLEELKRTLTREDIEELREEGVLSPQEEAELRAEAEAESR